MNNRRRLGRRPGQGQSGQAVTEYLLMLTIIISVVFGILYQFNTAFRVYTDSFFGGYIACLLETGELPGLGGTTTGVCAAEFKAFDIKAGTTHAGSGGGGSGGGGSSSGNRQGDRKGANGASTPRTSSDNSASESRSADSSGGGSSRPSSSFLSQRSNQERKNVGELSGKESEEAEARGLKAGKGGFAVGDLANAKKDQVRMTIDRRIFSEEEEKQLGGKQSRVSAGTQNANNLRPKTLKVEVRPARAPAAEKEEEYSFGAFIRIILIILIVIALLLVVGGQALQISKSWEK